MAALFGRLKGNRGEVTRLGSKASGIDSTLQTWEGKVTTRLEADGSFCVIIGQLNGRGYVVAQGNVNRPCVMEDDLPDRGVGYPYIIDRVTTDNQLDL